MMSEKFPQPSPEILAKLDQEWLEKLEKLSFEAFELITPAGEKLDAEKAAFKAARENGEAYTPDLRPTGSKRQLLHLRIRLNMLKSYISRRAQAVLTKNESFTSEQPDDLTPDLSNLATASVEEIKLVAHLYIAKINEKLTELELIFASLRNDMQSFARYNQYLYGTPSTEILELTVADLREQIRKARAGEDSHAKGLAEALLGELPAHAEHMGATEEDSDDNAAMIMMQDLLAKELLQILGEGFDFSDDDKQLSAEEVQTYFQRFVDSKLPETDWQVEIYDGKLFNVSQSRKSIQIPQTVNLSPKRLAELLAHEGLKHVMSRESGNKSTLRLLGSGLSRYETGEEGTATLFEELVTEPKKEIIHTDRLLAIALASGADRNGKVRTFSETFEIMRKYYEFIRYTVDKQDAKKSKINSFHAAWLRCWRTYRGTDSTTSYFGKDALYAEGNAQVKNFIAEMAVHNPAEDVLALLTIGKWNVGDKLQLYYLAKLGLTEVDFDQPDIFATSEALAN